jgi:hypothetical protein
MTIFNGRQHVAQLEKRKGGYFYLRVEKALVDRLPQGRQTRLLCRLEDGRTIRCGLNPLGDGDFFIILSTANLAAIRKGLGDEFSYSLALDPDPLGVDMPEVLQALLEQDEELAARFEALTPGKKRGLIHQLSRIKNIDLQVSRAEMLIRTADKPRQRGH